MERVDVVELEPLVLDVARACEAVNHDVLHNPKVHVTIGDARETLLTEPRSLRRHRVGAVQSVPRRHRQPVHASSTTAPRATRLTDDGVFAQWVQGYEIDARTLRTIYATMAAVFPQVETWQTNRGDLVLLATTRPRGVQRRGAARAHRRGAVSRRRSRTRGAPWTSRRAGALSGDRRRGARVRRQRRASRSTPTIATSSSSVWRDRSAAPDPTLVADIRELARAMGASRPPLDSDAGIAWPAVDTRLGELRRLGACRWRDARVAAGRAAAAGRRCGATTRPATSPARARSVAAAIGAAARSVGAGDGGRPRGGGGSDTALPLIEQLRALSAGRGGHRAGDAAAAPVRRIDEAAAALESAFARYRVDPWPQLRFKQKALTLADAVTARDPPTARRLFDALRSRSPCAPVDNMRLLTAAELATRFDFKGACREPIGALEPHVPWTASVPRDAARLLSGQQRSAARGREPRADEFLLHEPLPIAPR